MEVTGSSAYNSLIDSKSLSLDLDFFFLLLLLRRVSEVLHRDTSIETQTGVRRGWKLPEVEHHRCSFRIQQGVSESSSSVGRKVNREPCMAGGWPLLCH